MRCVDRMLKCDVLICRLLFLFYLLLECINIRLMVCVPANVQSRRGPLLPFYRMNECYHMGFQKYIYILNIFDRAKKIRKKNLRKIERESYCSQLIFIYAPFGCRQNWKLCEKVYGCWKVFFFLSFFGCLLSLHFLLRSLSKGNWVKMWFEKNYINIRIYEANTHRLVHQ